MINPKTRPPAQIWVVALILVMVTSLAIILVASEPNVSSDSKDGAVSPSVDASEGAIFASKPPDSDKPHDPGAVADSEYALTIEERLRPQIALVIDDWGYGWDAAEGFLRLGKNSGVKLTTAVLPFLPYTRDHAREAEAAGFEVLLHLPMQPANETLTITDDMLTVVEENDQLLGKLQGALSEVPQAHGVNNHMGSLATTDERIMRLVLGQLKERGLFFLDSHTSPSSVAPEIARELDLPFAVNTLFIDHIQDVEAIKDRLQTLATIAQNTGWAIGIGHVKPATLTAIEETLPNFTDLGIVIVPVSSLLHIEEATNLEEEQNVNSL